MVVLMCASCLDKAKADWDRCNERDKAYDVAGAYSACAAAAAADPKSGSGQAAAKKLVDLQLMLDKMKAERDDKVARDDAIKHEVVLAQDASVTATMPIAVPLASQAASAAPPQDPSSISRAAKALAMSGDAAGARALLEPLVKSGKGTKDDVRMLIGICKSLRDVVCVAQYKKGHGI